MANAVGFIIVARQLIRVRRQTKRKLGGVVIRPGLRMIGLQYDETKLCDLQLTNIGIQKDGKVSTIYDLNVYE